MILQNQSGIAVETSFFFGIHLDLLPMGGIESRITLKGE